MKTARQIVLRSLFMVFDENYPDVPPDSDIPFTQAEHLRDAQEQGRRSPCQ